MIAKILTHPMVSLDESRYLSAFIVIAAMLNFLAGINIDMYSPSMPAIANQFAVSVVAVKSTIGVSLLGWGLGCIVFGVLIDALGRKAIICFGLFFYMVASFLAIWSHSLHDVMIARFIQGLMVSTITIGCRALIIDGVTGSRYAIAMLYASLAYSCGTVFGPFIGGALQEYLGWQANFIAFGIVGLVFLTLLTLFIRESFTEKQMLSLNIIIKNYLSVLKNKNFIIGVLVVTLSNIELLLYPTIGPFIVENRLHQSAIVYGDTALIVGLGYLGGALLCRFLLHVTEVKNIYRIALGILIIAVFIATTFSFIWDLNLFTLLLPITLIVMTVGLITPNVMGANLRLFPRMAGVAMSVQVGIWVMLTALGMFIISHAQMNSLSYLARLYAVLVLMQFIIFFKLHLK